MFRQQVYNASRLPPCSTSTGIMVAQLPPRTEIANPPSSHSLPKPTGEISFRTAVADPGQELSDLLSFDSHLAPSCFRAAMERRTNKGE